MRANNRDQLEGSRLLVTLALVLICIGYCLWVLSLPLFPTQDGPLHLYYASVLRSLLLDANSPYSDFFYVKHIAPPYSLHYYLLIAMMGVCRPLVADKAIVCIYVVSFIFGFRFATTSLGNNGQAASLLGSTLVLNWPLGMGFINYSLSLTMMLWAVGMWMRMQRDGSILWGLCTAFMAVIMNLTHPMPLLLLLCIQGLDLITQHRLLGSSRAAKHAPAKLWIGAWCFGICILNLLYVIHFRGPSDVNYFSWLAYRTVGQNVQNFCDGHGVSLLGSYSWPGYIEHLILAGVLGVILAMIISSGRCRDSLYGMAFWLVLSCFLFAAFLFLPHSLGGTFFVTDRLILAIWMFLLLAVATRSSINRSYLQVLMFSAVATTACTIASADNLIRPVARAIDESTHFQGRTTKAARGILVSPYQVDVATGNDLSFMPYAWAGVHYFREHEAVLFNGSWLQYDFFPLGSKRALPASVTSVDVGSPMALLSAMYSQGNVRQITSEEAQFVLLFDPTQSDDLFRLIMGSQSFAERGWWCPAVTSPWLTQCFKHDFTR